MATTATATTAIAPMAHVCVHTDEDTEINLHYPMHEAIVASNIPTIKRLLAKMDSTNVSSNKFVYETILLTAVQYSIVEVVQLFTERRIHISCVAMFNAYERGDMDIINVLASHHKYGFVIGSMFSETFKFPMAVKHYLERFKPTMSIANDMLDRTFIMGSSIEVIKILLDYGTDVNTWYKSSARSLLVLNLTKSLQYNLELMKLLLSRGLRTTDPLYTTYLNQIIHANNISADSQRSAASEFIDLLIQYPLNELGLSYQASQYIMHKQIETFMLGMQKNAGENSSVQRMCNHDLSEKYVLCIVIDYL